MDLALYGFRRSGSNQRWRRALDGLSVDDIRSLFAAGVRMRVVRPTFTDWRWDGFDEIPTVVECSPLLLAGEAVRKPMSVGEILSALSL